MFRKILFLSVIYFLFSAAVSAQEEFPEPVTHLEFERPDSSIIWGYPSDALMASMIPNADYVGVYVMIDTDYPYTMDQLILPIKSYFDHYEVPAFFIKQIEPYEGQGARIGIFADGKVVIGDLESGSFSLSELQNDPESVFTVIKASYHLAKRGKY